MIPDLWNLYGLMLKSRLFEEAIARLWHDGLISGEMHPGTGEEAIIAGVNDHLREGDALALDHRGTSALLMRGVNPVLILRELLGYQDGLCRGMGGHMHLFSKEHLVASSGIVGAEGPAAVGFALSAQYLRPGSIAVAFFGEGAMNQGMLMESMNMASAWNLPVLFVCKDDGWSISTQSKSMTGGDLITRARGLGLQVDETDGRDVSRVWETCRLAVERARTGQGPSFMHARCVHLEGHFLGFQLIKMIRDPLTELPKASIPVTKAFLHHKGGTIGKRLSGLKIVMGSILATLHDPRRDAANDPIQITRKVLQSDEVRLKGLEYQIEKDLNVIFESALKEVTT